MSEMATVSTNLAARVAAGRIVLYGVTAPMPFFYVKVVQGRGQLNCCFVDRMFLLPTVIRVVLV